MLFSSTTFLYLFLPIVLLFYYVFFRKSRFLQNLFLLCASLIFYAWGEPKFVLVMLLSIIANWGFGLAINKHRSSKKISRLIIGLTIFFNLGILYIFKYLNFTGSLLYSIFAILLPLPNILLPIGISFFTFQAMSYVLDVYRGQGQVQTNILFVGLYITFFPQLIAGPIVRYETVADEIQNRKETWDDFFDGFARFVVGLSKKVLLANCFALLADYAFNAVNASTDISVMSGWLGAVAYTLQIFFDFSGYSDMAIGLGRMFGFHFLENFNYPYISRSITEFWRRWHMSLGTWFRDYLYYPLGGSRCSIARNIFNLFVVWMLTGLWHGANFTFILWGLVYFVLLTFEKVTKLHKKTGRLLDIGKWVYTIFFVILGWVLFRAESVTVAITYMKSMFGLNAGSFCDSVFISLFKQNAIPLTVGILLCTPLFKTLSEKTENSIVAGCIKVIGLMGLLLLSVASLVSSSYNPFIYFNF